MRGNHTLLLNRPLANGSIPARAGEPFQVRRRSVRSGVYPRTCGGTGWTRSSKAGNRGLSPHVRGNREVDNNRGSVMGSIPARAGEPDQRYGKSTSKRVYPRTCGGTKRPYQQDNRRSGLSPHVRGNHEELKRRPVKRRSIPARAGEPIGLLYPYCQHRVYPRTCGGTAQWSRGYLMGMGLSPHVRGNRHLPSFHFTRTGSIPARAGEPWTPKGSRRTNWVYPRTCGGTAVPHRTTQASMGLSPHVRGNHCLRAGAHDGIGSIPARAGEPT